MIPSIQFRHDEHGNIDEIFATNSTVHIEQMHDGALFIAIEIHNGPIWRGRIDGRNITITSEDDA